MVDKSNYPCRHCKHRQNDHGKHFGYCYACQDEHESGNHHFELIENLEFLEWVVKEKEK